MLEREEIIAALWQRMASVSGVQRTARNPVNPPTETDLPCINIFELSDEVTDAKSRGGSRSPAYKRELRVVVEPFVLGDSEPQATQKLGLFVIELKKKLYEGGNTLGLSGVEVLEEEMSQVYRPPNTEKIAGIGITLKIKYVEDISRLGI
jgi:hypothetical protein